MKISVVSEKMAVKIPAGVRIWKTLFHDSPNHTVPPLKRVLKGNEAPQKVARLERARYLSEKPAGSGKPRFPWNVRKEDA